MIPNIKRLLIKAVFISLLVLLLAYPVLAQDGGTQASSPDPQQLAGVLLWLGAGGSLLAVNWVVANFLEKQEWWNKLAKWVKYVVPPFAAILLGLGANELVEFDQLVSAVQPYWFIISNIIIGYFGSQLGHVMTRSGGLLFTAGTGTVIRDSSTNEPVR